MQHVGIYIATLREASGLTQAQLARLVEASEDAVRSWERGRHEPKFGLMRAVLRALSGEWADVDRLYDNSASAAAARELAEFRHKNPPAQLLPEEERLIEALRTRRPSAAKQRAILTLLEEG